VKKYIVVAAVNIALLLLSALFAAAAWRLTSSLESQDMAKRWGAGGPPYTQVSLFLDKTAGFSAESVYMFRANIDKSLADASVKGNAVTLPDGTVLERGRLWTDAYSGTLDVFAAAEAASAQAAMTYTGGDYFLFHPLPLAAGSYYSDDDLMKDRVVIDVDLAWQLYGATNVAGKRLEVSGRAFYVAGVVYKETDKATREVYGDKPRIYMPYESASELFGGLKSVCYEACLPSPIKGQGLGIFEDAVAVNEAAGAVVENSERYSLANLLRVAAGYSKARVRTDAVVLPYFESAARIVESKAALLVCLALAALLFPVLTLFYLFSRLFKKRKAFAERIWRGLWKLLNFRRRGCSP
jgi:hypothetical protein